MIFVSSTAVYGQSHGEWVDESSPTQPAHFSGTRLLEAEKFDAILVFVRTKIETVELAQRLEARGFAASALNGYMEQRSREQTVQRLKDGKIDIVIATDVAAAEAALRAAMLDEAFGAAGARVVLEECLAGDEMSYFVIADGERFAACGKRFAGCAVWPPPLRSVMTTVPLFVPSSSVM